MIYTYDELLNMKDNGCNLDFDSVSKEQLENLFFAEKKSDSIIANLYGVSKAKVYYKKNKLHVNYAKYIKNKTLNNDIELMNFLNNNSKDTIMQIENVNSIAKVLAYYIFINGPFKDINNNKISQKNRDEIINYMINKLAGIVSYVVDNQWLKLEVLLNSLENEIKNLNDSVIDTSDIDEIFDLYFDSEDNNE